ncbi:dihydrofolate reductase family protein [Nocardioides speluncae]|uniref:dihydrofolate reductase family protein n=1 Tax=Nocardioides speluncae TaxID=2670337 RepID=UPI000D689FF6|nr:dihydrofolate reductase family protein [Nocardioides speluncae]
MSIHGQGKVIMFVAVSMDGYVANEQDEVGPLFDWYGAGGGVSYSLDGDPAYAFDTTAETADFLSTLVAPIGALVIGRRVFDLMNGWGGNAPAGDHVYVVTHQPPTDWEFADTAPFSFVTDIADAVKQALETAGDRNVSLAAGDLGGNVLREGLVDRVILNLVPTVFGTGRPFFGTGGVAEPVLFDDPVVAQGRRVTHLCYDIRR